LWLTSLIFPKKDIQVKEETVRLYQGRASIFGGLLVVMILGIFSIIPYGFAAGVVLVIVLLMKKSLLKQVDYRLLITFVSFFVIVGNI
jgi:ABC-type multidrug transport system permease subunit